MCPLRKLTTVRSRVVQRISYCSSSTRSALSLSDLIGFPRVLARSKAFEVQLRLPFLIAQQTDFRSFKPSFHLAFAAATNIIK
jgi:hypothetical protein